MQIVGMEKFYNDGKDFLIIILKDVAGLLHSEIYEVANIIPISESYTRDEVINKAREKIQLDITAKN